LNISCFKCGVGIRIQVSERNDKVVVKCPVCSIVNIYDPPKPTKKEEFKLVINKEYKPKVILDTRDYTEDISIEEKIDE
jgi:uncharacterized Zn finger protein